LRSQPPRARTDGNSGLQRPRAAATCYNPSMADAFAKGKALVPRFKPRTLAARLGEILAVVVEASVSMPRRQAPMNCEELWRELYAPKKPKRSPDTGDLLMPVSWLRGRDVSSGEAQFSILSDSTALSSLLKARCSALPVGAAGGTAEQFRN